MSREYLIEILRRQRQQQNRQKTMVLPSRRYEPLGRRRLNRGIRIFDCGQIRSGDTYVNLPYIDPSASIAITNNGATFDNLDTTVDSTNIALRDGLIFDYPFSEWPHIFRRIDAAQTDLMVLRITWNGVTYGTDTTPDLWRDGVFFPPENYSSFFTTWQNFSEVANTATGKLTATYDPDADAVSPELGKSFDIYLMPMLWTYGASAIKTLLGPPVTQYFDVLGYYSILYPRDVYLDPAHPLFGQVSYPFNQFYSPFSPGIDDFAHYSAAYNNMIYGREFIVSSRAGRVQYIATVPTFTSITPADFPNTLIFPPPPAMIDLTGIGGPTDLDNSANRALVLPSLTAVIRKNGQNYYLWQT